MSQTLDCVISILIVEDSEFKIERLQIFLRQIAPNSIISISNDVISAQQCLEKNQYDLLILDIQLPLRYGESDPETNAGEIILEDLSLNSSYNQPNSIIAFTQFKESELRLRESFPEIGVITFDETSSNWKTYLGRVIVNLSKAKSISKKVIYCEGNNITHYNVVGLDGVVFWALKDSRAIYFAAKNESERYAIRDRDFLTTNEISILTSKPYFINYFILKYYCIENYLYHPENLAELISNFPIEEYVNEITKQKNEKIELIIQDYKISRLGYTDFIDNDKRNMDENPEEEIVVSLKSNDFEVYYKFFDMAGKKDRCFKKSFNKQFVEKYNIPSIELAKTQWFKKELEAIFSKIL